MPNFELPMNRYFLSLGGLDAHRILANWQWLMRPQAALMEISVFGDLVLRAPNGAVLWLDTLEGRLDEIALTLADFRQKLTDPELVDELFWPGFLDELERRGLKLAQGECYGFMIHPIIGGAIEVSNLEPINLVAYHTVISGLHQLPKGHRISEFTVDGQAP